MLPKTGLRVLDAARSVVDEIHSAMSRARPPWPGGAQLRDAVESIVANISEGFGRAEGPDRVHFLRIARGSAEETNERLRTLFAAGRIQAPDYWRIHHRLVAIARMLTSLMERICDQTENDDRPFIPKNAISEPAPVQAVAVGRRRKPSP